jgi:alkylglycerol monooxygenase
MDVSRETIQCHLWIRLRGGYSGITMIVVQLAGLSFVVFPYSFLVKHFSLFTIETNWVNYVLAYIAIDFSYYWGHRFHHVINYFWNSHRIHHSSEEFNLGSALRQTVTNFFNVFTVFLIPAAIIGVPAEIVFLIAPLHQIMQYWYHTRHIGKLGFLEHIIVTPSHHRVHHAMNPIYMDKNHSAIFIVWDKLFGTFQEELESEPPVYGVTRPARTFNPIAINFQHLFLLFKDAWRAENWMDKLTIWFRPTGWRPKGFSEKYAVAEIKDVHQFEKFNPTISIALFWWSIVQFFVIFFLCFHVFIDLSVLGKNGMLIFVLFVLAQTYSATELMNRNKWAPLFSAISTILCFIIYYFDPNFFALRKLSSMLPALLLVYSFVQVILSLVFSREKSTTNYATYNEVGRA